MPQALPGSHLDEFIGQTESSLTKKRWGSSPNRRPNVGRKPPLPTYGRRFSQTVQPHFVNALISQPLTLITPWHLPCILERVVRKLEILSFQSIACAKNKGGYP